MLSILIALILLVAGVGVVYLLLRRMNEEGIDIAAPGSCRRGGCGVPGRPLVDAAEQMPQLADDSDEQRKPEA